MDGYFFDPGWWPFEYDKEHRVADDVDITCEFAEVTGIITCNAVGGVDSAAPVEDGPLKGKVGFSFVINNSGNTEHTVQVSYKLVVLVDGTMDVGFVGNGGYKSDDGLSGGISVSNAVESSIGTRWEDLTDYTLKLKAVEN